MSAKKGFSLSRWVSIFIGAVLLFPTLSSLLIQQAFADSTSTWDFTTSTDYTVSSGALVAGTGGYAVSQLSFTEATDSMGSFSRPLDVTQLSSGRLIAGTISGELLRSDNNGATWTNYTSGCSTTGLIRVDAVGFAGTNAIAIGEKASNFLDIAYSSDGGVCWTDSNLTGLAGNGKSTLATGSLTQEVGGVIFALSRGGSPGFVTYTMKSVDHGVTWVDVTSPSINDTSIMLLGTRLYVTGHSNAGVPGSGTGIYYSDNSGSTWTEALNPGANSAGDSGSRLAYDSAAGVLYGLHSGPSASHAVLYTSANPAAATPTFTYNVITLQGDSASAAKDIVVTSTPGASRGEIYLASTSSSHAHIWRSVDGGTSFFASPDIGSEGQIFHMIRMDSDVDGNADDAFGILTGNGTDGDFYSASFATNPTVQNNTGIPFTSISDFTETVSSLSQLSALNYQISNDGATWYFWNGSAWTVAGNVSSDVSSASVIDANIGSFPSGTFYFKVVFSAAAGSTPPGVTNSGILDSLSISYVYTPPSITVVSPNGGEHWKQQDVHPITWTSVNVGAGDVITLSYSTNNGSSWTIINNTDGSPTQNDGEYEWTVPSVLTGDALVKVASGGTSDTSNAVFSIVDLSYGGGGSDQLGDVFPPNSSVNMLPIYTATVPFTVSITATDEFSGIDSVKLYYAFDKPAQTGAGLTVFEETSFDCGANCFAWPFTAPKGNGIYYFYSSAQDKAGHDNFLTKFSIGTPSVEAQTIVASATSDQPTAPASPANKLTVSVTNITITPGLFSAPIVVSSNHPTEKLPFPLYFYTTSTTGHFYDATFEELPTYLTIQATGNPLTNLQYTKLSASSGTFYYKDSAMQPATATIGDNFPLVPDTGLQNATIKIAATSKNDFPDQLGAPQELPVTGTTMPEWFLLGAMVLALAMTLRPQDVATRNEK